ncbi:hypothetical protein ACFLQR_03960, partial [Verrucomicrobiota bacterium]
MKMIKENAFRTGVVIAICFLALSGANEASAETGKGYKEGSLSWYNNHFERRHVSCYIYKFDEIPAAFREMAENGANLLEDSITGPYTSDKADRLEHVFREAEKNGLRVVLAVRMDAACMPGVRWIPRRRNNTLKYADWVTKDLPDLPYHLVDEDPFYDKRMLPRDWADPRDIRVVKAQMKGLFEKSKHSPAFAGFHLDEIHYWWYDGKNPFDMYLLRCRYCRLP